MSYVDNPFINPRILSYCPGFLGLERGLKRAIGSIRTVAYVEIEAFICENLLVGMEAGLLDAAPIWANLKTFDASPFRGKVDFITGGYPCQPFSNAGQRMGTEDPRHLYPYLERDIDTIRPVGCFFENVSGHITLGFDKVLKSLHNLGYAVEAGIFTAEEVGAPHQRERLFILAIRKDILANPYHDGSNVPKKQQGIETRNGGSQTRANYVFKFARLCSKSINERYGKGDMANTAGVKWRLSKSEKRKHHPNIIRRSKKLANTNDVRSYRPRDSSNRGERLKDGCSRSGMAHACITGLQGNKLNRTPNKGIRQSKSRGTITKSSINDWPSRPGQQQFAWEEPRTIITEQSARLLGGYGKKYPESFPTWQIEQVAFNDLTGSIKPGLDSSIDGYNYREDLLRAYGNSVIEQTASLAFTTLMKKHFG